MLEEYVECVESTTKLACTGGAAAWEAKWIETLVSFLQLHYNCIVNIGLFMVSFIFNVKGKKVKGANSS